MKISKLYLKIFLAFVAVLITAEAVVYGVMLSGKMHPPFFFDSIERSMMIDRLIKREMNEIPVTPNTLRNRLNPLLKLLVEGNSGQIWITDWKNVVVSASFDGPPPDLKDDLVSIDLKAPKDVHFFVVDAKDYKSVYVDSVVWLAGNFPLYVHFLQGKHPRRDEAWLLKSLLFLAALGALFLFPISRRITKPILLLSETAERLGQGDFSHRVPEKGHDEVAVLASKFNLMADRLETMVMTGKELTAHISHELRSPLARMRISLQMLMEQPDVETMACNGKQLNRIEKEIENMDILIGKILDLSKLDMRELPPMTDVVDMAERLRVLLDKYAPMIAQRGIRINASLSTVPGIACHGQAVDILLDNVLNNAIKYTAEGGSIAVDLNGGQSIGITVCNTHEPLLEYELSTMFKPFHRLNGNTEPGTGLGLAVAQKIVTMHQGTIHTSNEKDSVCVTITLPLNPY